MIMMGKSIRQMWVNRTGQGSRYGTSGSQKLIHRSRSVYKDSIFNLYDRNFWSRKATPDLIWLNRSAKHTQPHVINADYIIIHRSLKTFSSSD